MVMLQLFRGFPIYGFPLRQPRLDFRTVLIPLRSPLVIVDALVALQHAHPIPRDKKVAVDFAGEFTPLCSISHGRTRHSGVHHFSVVLGGVREPREGHLFLEHFLLAEKTHRQITLNVSPPRALRKAALLASIFHVNHGDPFRKQLVISVPAGRVALDNLHIKLVIEDADLARQAAVLHGHPSVPSVVELQQNRVG